MINIRKKLKFTAIIFIIGFILFVVNSFVGNPISADIATSKIEGYVQETYSTQNLEVPKAKYNAKFSEYYSVVESKSSQDTKFSVSWRSGKICDDYPYEVANKFTTSRRLNNNFDDIIETLVAKEFLYDTRLVGGHLIDKNDDLEALTLDMPFDINNIPLPVEVVVWTSSEEISYDILAKRLLELHQIMIEHKIKVDYYSMRLEGLYSEDEEKMKMPQSSDELSVEEFPASKITDDGLARILEEHQKQWEESRRK